MTYLLIIIACAGWATAAVIAAWAGVALVRARRASHLDLDLPAVEEHGAQLRELRTVLLANDQVLGASGPLTPPTHPTPAPADGGLHDEDTIRRVDAGWMPPVGAARIAQIMAAAETAQIPAVRP